MVHPQWQGSGLGSAMLRRMEAHARARGVRGFIAEIMAANERMLRLARHGDGGAAAGVSIENLGGTLRVTTLF